MERAKKKNNIPDPDAVLVGKIASIRRSQNYGFICILEPPDRLGEEIFFHASGVPSGLATIDPGDTVTFSEMLTAKGLRGHHVTKVRR